MIMNSLASRPAGEDDSLGPAILAVELCVFIPACIIIILRIWVRLAITCNFGWDDATIVFSHVRIYGVINSGMTDRSILDVQHCRYKFRVCRNSKWHGTT